MAAGQRLLREQSRHDQTHREPRPGNRHGTDISVRLPPPASSTTVSPTGSTLTSTETRTPALVAAWVRRQVATGATTPITAAVGNLLRLLDGTADALSGNYLTAHDDVATLAKTKGHRSP